MTTSLSVAELWQLLLAPFSVLFSSDADDDDWEDDDFPETMADAEGEEEEGEDEDAW